MIEIYLALLLFGVGSYINVNNPIKINTKSQKNNNTNGRSEANLSNANLSKANLSEANLSEANLSEANLSEVQKEDFTTLSPAQIKPFVRKNKQNQLQPLPEPENIVPMRSKKNIEHEMCNSSIISPLTGQTLTKENFLTNSDGVKITPFFRGSVKQNIKDISQTRLYNHTGKDPLKDRKKREIAPLFKPTPSLTNVHGQKNWTHKVMDRYIESKHKTNELPFEQFRVGRPGLNDKSGASGNGFDDFDKGTTARQGMQYNCIDKLRVGNKKQQTHTPPAVSGKLFNDSRGVHGEVFKNRTEKSYPLDPSFNSLGSRARADGPKTNENFVVRDKNKKLSRAHFGTAGPTERVKPIKIATTQKTRRNQLRNYGVRNIEFGDLKTMTYFMDKARATKKQNMIGNPRPEGNMDVSIPSKGVAFDPNDIARTTKKEQLIDNKYLAIASTFEKKLQIYDYDTKPKITIRNTTPNIDPNRNLDGADKPQSYLTDSPKVTIREQTENNEYKSNAHYGFDNGYMTNPAEAPYTNKQFLSDYYYAGGAESREPGQALYMSAYNASLNTNKERIARGRKPMGSNVKLARGGDTVNILHKKQSHALDTSRKVDTHVFSKPPDKNTKMLTNQRVILSNKEIRDRIKPDILDAFNNNPYSQSLHSSTAMTCNETSQLGDLSKLNSSQKHMAIQACCDPVETGTNCNYSTNETCNPQQIQFQCKTPAL